MSGWSLESEQNGGSQKLGVTYLLAANQRSPRDYCAQIVPARHRYGARVGFNDMNKVREVDRFLYEENEEIMPDNIPISFLDIKLGGEPTHVSNGVPKGQRQKTLSRDPWTVPL